MSERGFAAVERHGQAQLAADTITGTSHGPRASLDVLSARYDGPTAPAWGWGIGPTVNSWLHDIPRSERMAICAAVPTVWEGHRVTYVPGRRLTISRPRPGSKRLRDVRGAATITDLSNFWPGNDGLASVAYRFGLDVPGLVVDGDQARPYDYGGWSDADLTAYAEGRAQLIGQLAARLLDRLDEIDLASSRQPWGVSSLGSLVLRRSGRWWVARYRPDRQPICDGQPMLDLLFRAYYGGRIETTLSGTLQGPVWRLDLRSAYLWALSWVGPLGMAWEHVSTFTPAITDRMSVWRVSWSLPPRPEAVWGPFPYREHSRASLKYPHDGTGWYWWPEVRSALRLWGPEAITIHEGYVSPRSSHRPMLAQAERLYALRQDLEASDDPMADLVKSTGNSAYGKLAQQQSFNGRVGDWYNPGIAGWITSAVRARILDQVGIQTRDRFDVAQIMTDGLLTNRPPAPDFASARLGGWSVERYESAQLIATGLYRLVRADGTAATATTRVSQSLDFDWLLDTLTERDHATVSGRWFVPHILADLRPDEYGPLRCRWIDTPSSIEPADWLSAKRSDSWSLLGLDWHRQLAYTGIPYADDPMALSAPYPLPPAWSEPAYDPVHDAAGLALRGVA